MRFANHGLVSEHPVHITINDDCPHLPYINFQSDPLGTVFFFHIFFHVFVSLRRVQMPREEILLLVPLYVSMLSNREIKKDAVQLFHTIAAHLGQATVSADCTQSKHCVVRISDK